MLDLCFEHSPDSALVVLKPGSRVANAQLTFAKLQLGAVRRCREPALATRGISIDGGALA
jgi:hypothetical protein